MENVGSKNLLAASKKKKMHTEPDKEASRKGY